MNERPSLEAMVTDWLHDEAPDLAPRQLLTATMDRVAGVRQDAGGPAAWLGGASDWSPRSRFVFGILVAALLVVGVVIAGAFLVPRLVLGPPVNGWIAFAADGQAGPGLESNGFDPRGGRHGDIYLVREGVSARRIVGADGDGIDQSCPAFSPDGRRLAWTETPAIGGLISSGTAVMVSAVDRNATPEGIPTRIETPIAIGNEPPCAKWSPDGRRLAFEIEGRLVAATLDGAMKTLDPVPGSSTRAGFDWSPDSASLAYVDGDAWIIPVDGRAPRAIMRLSPEDIVGSIAWSTDGSQIALGVTSSSPTSKAGEAGPLLIRLIDPDRANRDPIDIRGASGPGPAFAWSPEGRRLAYFAAEGIAIVDLAGTGTPLLSPYPTGLEHWDQTGMTWAPDTRRLVYVAMAANGVDYVLVSLSTEPGHAPIVLTPMTRALYRTDVNDISWQGVH